MDGSRATVQGPVLTITFVQAGVGGYLLLLQCQQQCGERHCLKQSQCCWLVSNASVYLHGLVGLSLDCHVMM